MNEANHPDPSAASLKRPLTPEELSQAQLGLGLEVRTRLEEDLLLNQWLRELPDLPLATNFTAQVLEAVRPRPHRGRFPKLSRSAVIRWVQAGSLAALVALAGVALHQHRTSVRSQRAHDLAAFSNSAPLPPLNLLRDFDAIRHLNEAPRQTEEDQLLAALQ